MPDKKVPLAAADANVDPTTGRLRMCIALEALAALISGGRLPVAPPLVTSLAGGTKTVAAAATPEKLVATATPCRMVWVGAPVVIATGLPANTKAVLVGNSAGQNIPLMPSNYEGYFLAIDDASKVYVKAGVDGEKIEYRVFA